MLQYSYFSVISRFPLKTVHPFRHFLAVLPPLTQSWNSEKVLDTRFSLDASNIVCGVRGGVGSVWTGKHPRNAKMPQDHDCRLKARLCYNCQCQSLHFVHSRTLMLTDKLKTIPHDLNVGKILLMMYIFLQGLHFNTYFKVQGVWVVTLLLINLL